MKTKFNVKVACGAIAAALAILLLPNSRAQDTPSKLTNKPAPEFQLPLLDGGQFDLKAQRGKSIVLLDFWATWCGPCRQAMPTLVEVARDYADKQVRYYAVNLREKPSVIKAYLEKEKLKIQVPLDEKGKIAEQYGVRGIPTMVIIDRAGVVRAVHVGASPDLKATLRRTLDELVAQKEPASGEGK